jgi:hypothetical protein
MSTIHVVPLNDIREHEDSGDCWCKPRLEDGVWIHYSMDGRELLEDLSLQCAEIPLFLAQVAQAYLDPYRFTNPKDCSGNVFRALQWLDKRASLLTFSADVMTLALSQFNAKFFDFADEQSAIEDLIQELKALKGNLKPIHFFQLAKIFQIPVMLLLDKSAEHLIVGRAELELLTTFAVYKDFITHLKGCEILNIDIQMLDKLIDKLKAEISAEFSEDDATP